MKPSKVLISLIMLFFIAIFLYKMKFNRTLNKYADIETRFRQILAKVNDEMPNHSSQLSSAFLNACSVLTEQNDESEGVLYENDEWGNRIKYKVSTKSITLISSGSDRVFATDDDVIGIIEFNPQNQGTIRIKWSFHSTSVSRLEFVYATTCENN